MYFLLFFKLNTISLLSVIYVLYSTTKQMLLFLNFNTLERLMYKLIQEIYGSVFGVFLLKI